MPKLQRTFSGFPDGLPGIGLALLRVLSGGSVGVAILRHGLSFSQWYEATVAVILVVSSLAMVLGYLTPLVSMVQALLLIANAWFGAHPPVLAHSSVVAADLAVVSVALMLIGPGAYSLDARLFGRREIVISDSFGAGK